MPMDMVPPAEYYICYHLLAGVHTCEDGWTLNGDSCFYFDRTARYYKDADTNCQALGGFLTSIHSQTEQNFLSSEIFVSRSTLISHFYFICVFASVLNVFNKYFIIHLFLLFIYLLYYLFMSDRDILLTFV